MKPFVLGIAGGAGSGKSSLSAGLIRTFPSMVHIFHVDDYFRPESDIPVRAHMPNWDSPQALDYAQMARELAALKANKTQKPLIIVEGRLALHLPKIRRLLDMSVYLDGPFYHQLDRSLTPRLAEYNRLVLHPMHDRFVGPSKVHATKTIDSFQASQQVVTEQVARLLVSKLT